MSPLTVIALCVETPDGDYLIQCQLFEPGAGDMHPVAISVPEKLGKEDAWKAVDESIKGLNADWDLGVTAIIKLDTGRIECCAYTPESYAARAQALNFFTDIPESFSPMLSKMVEAFGPQNKEAHCYCEEILNKLTEKVSEFTLEERDGRWYAPNTPFSAATAVPANVADGFDFEITDGFDPNCPVCRDCETFAECSEVREIGDDCYDASPPEWDVFGDGVSKEKFNETFGDIFADAAKCRPRTTDELTAAINEMTGKIVSRINNISH